MFSKTSSSSYPAQMNSADRTVTINLPTSPHPNPSQAAEIAAFQYQQELLADFFSGGAAPRPRPPPPASSSDHSSQITSQASSYGSTGKKSKWGSMLVERDAAKAKANAVTNVYPEPTTLSKRMFQFGFACPLLWLMGAVFLFRPPRPRIEHEGLPVNSAEERGRRIAVYELAEERWAWRCLWGSVATVVIVSAVVIGAVLGTRSH
ncbi:hypothetical protein BD311DRAFT_532721 [Dichomitus squalens]|uniref:Uncharacterized protein n=1 Tax=Dichomitus squalens TaxID=114155 RepID=A0A4Q9MC30_9APHY|nr:hypothetical protein BD311DRAFT_532721 [Dichomitus squalens]